MGGTRFSGIKRIGALIAAVAMGAVALAGVLSPSADATSNFAFSRIFAGTNRYDTARLVALQTFGTADHVLLATGLNYPDALAASYLAGQMDVPILLTDPLNLPNETLSALQQLDTTQVTILGGPNAVSGAVENSLRSGGVLVDRVQGLNRYSTALEIAKRPLAGAVGHIFGERTALLASGGTFADALAAGPLAYAAHFPLLLTPGDALGAEAAQGFTQLNIQRVIILGGPAAISQAVEDDLRNRSINVTRLGGADRTETATTIADFELSVPGLGFHPFHVNLARGDDAGIGADALAGGPHAGRERTPILLTNSPTTLDGPSNANTKFLFRNSPYLGSGHLFGGQSAIAESVRIQAEYAAGRTPPEAPSGVTTPTVYLVNVVEQYFISTAGRTYYYGDSANDVHQLKGVGVTVTGFSAVLNSGDIVTVNYNAVNASSSTFNITNDTIETPGNPLVSVAGNHVVVFSQESPLRSIGTVYTLQRAAYSLPLCLGSLGGFVDITNDDNYDGFFDDVNVPDGCYRYRVKASVPSMVPLASEAVSATTGNVTVPQGQPDTDPPRIVDLRVAADGGVAGQVGPGDVHTFTFNERMSPAIAANGSAYTLSGPLGPIPTVNVICGTNATCSLTDVKDGNLLSPKVLYSVLTVTITGTPQQVTGSTPVIYPATVIATNTTTFKDASNNTLQRPTGAPFPLSDVTL